MYFEVKAFLQIAEDWDAFGIFTPVAPLSLDVIYVLKPNSFAIK